MKKTKCAYCLTKFDKTKRFKTGRKNYFCNQKCCRLYRTKITNKTVKCVNCNILFTKYLREINKSKHNFCSHSCSATYNNTHKTTGIRRSKLEQYLEQQLTKLYPDLEIHFNRKDTINSELDIYIPSLKLAFELNGIFHYEPIYGEDKLKQTQNNDDRKFQACLEKKIELVLIDTSKQKYFKPQSSQQFLDIITNIIGNKS